MIWFTFLKANSGGSSFPPLSGYNACCHMAVGPKLFGTVLRHSCYIFIDLWKEVSGHTAFRKSPWAWRRQEQKFHSPWCLVSDDTCNSRGLRLVAELRPWMKDDPIQCLLLKDTLSPLSFPQECPVKLRAMCSPILVSFYLLHQNFCVLAV